MRKITLCVALGLAVAMAGLPAWGEAECDGVAATFNQLERDIPALYLLNGLFLSREQSEKLAGAIRTLKRLDGKQTRESSRLAEKIQKGLEKHAKSMVKDAVRGKEPDAITGATKVQRIREAQGELRQLRGEKCRTVASLADRVYALLSPSQRKILVGFKPCFIPARDFRDPERVGQAMNDRSFVEDALEGVRRASGLDLEKARDEAIAGMVPNAMYQHHIVYSEEAAREMKREIARAFDKELMNVLRMSDAEFELEKTDVAQKIVPIEELPEGYELRKTARSRIMGYLLNPGIHGIVAARGEGKTPIYSGEKLPTRSVVKRLNPRTIHKAAVALAGLKLSPAQAVQLREVVQGVIKQKHELGDEAGKIKRDAIYKYERLKRELGLQSVAGKTEGTAGAAHGGVKEIKKNRANEVMMQAESRVDLMLGADQVAYLSHVACPSPLAAEEPELPDIEKVRKRASRLLADAVGMGSTRFERDKAEMCWTFVRSVVGESRENDFDVDLDAEVSRAMKILDRVRAMKRFEFARVEEDVAAEVVPRRSRPRPPKYSTKFYDGEPEKLPTPVAEILFNDTALEILGKVVPKDLRAGLTRPGATAVR